MNIYIKLDSKHAYELNADGYEYTCLPDFKRYGNGYVDVTNLYPTFTTVRYESELLRSGIPECKKRISNPYRFWTNSKCTKVWLVEDQERIPIDIFELRWIGDKYHILHISIQKLMFNIKNYGDHTQLFIRNIYLEEN